MNPVDAGGVYLVGEAAKSYVQLQWARFFSEMLIGFSIGGLILYALFCLWKSAKEEGKK